MSVKIWYLSTGSPSIVFVIIAFQHWV